MLISLIVPCYNEQEALPIFYEESTKVLAGMNCEYEFLFVNDGSKDATLSILKGLAEKDEHVTYLSFSRNFGKEAAMYAGFTNARGDYVAVMDADMQDPKQHKNLNQKCRQISDIRHKLLVNHIHAAARPDKPVEKVHSEHTAADHRQETLQSLREILSLEQKL